MTTNGNDPQYPQGKLNEDDEGQLAIALGIENDNVILHFGKRVAWIAGDPDFIDQLADAMKEKAQIIRDRLQS